MYVDSVQTVNMNEARAHLSQIIDEVKRLGRPMIIAKSGKPQVKIVPLDEPVNKPRFGFMKKQAIQIPEDFDRLYQDEIADMFAGKE